MSDIMEMLRAAARETETESELTDTQVEALLLDLKDHCARYQAGCAFSIGDVVTPRKGYGTRGAGAPHVVLEVLECGEEIFNAETQDPGGTGSSGFGRRLDMRVVTRMGGKICMFWEESVNFEPFSR